MRTAVCRFSLLSLLPVPGVVPKVIVSLSARLSHELLHRRQRHLGQLAQVPHTAHHTSDVARCDAWQLAQKRLGWSARVTISKQVRVDIDISGYVCKLSKSGVTCKSERSRSHHNGKITH